MTFALNFDWLTNEYVVLTLAAAAMGLAVMAMEFFLKPAFDMSL
jgi:hypothetical protein